MTRFRAYQLGCAGSSFSYFADGRFTHIEARLNDTSAPSLAREMATCGVETAYCLHITSWDADHCAASELPLLLEMIRPVKIECPGYEPSSDNGRTCRQILQDYRSSQLNSNRPAELIFTTPQYIDGLNAVERLGFNNVFYGPRWIDDGCANNNSTIKFFREGSFNLLSLGDVESHDISSRLRRDKYLRREVDLMILAHHGADNGFTNKQLLSHIEPQLAICSSNYDNQYDHPTDEIRALLFEQDIRLMTTKTGDIVVKSLEDHTGLCRAINLCANSTEISSHYDFKSRKSTLLSFNADTIRELYSPRSFYRNLRK
jgi:competence protein ComEC